MQSQSLKNNTGVAMVETSRGLLTHVVQLHNNRVINYRIIAPTEWNFHSQGALAQALLSLVPSAQLKAQAMLVCQAFDPCVAFKVEVQHA